VQNADTPQTATPSEHLPEHPAGLAPEPPARLRLSPALARVPTREVLPGAAGPPTPVTPPAAAKPVPMPQAQAAGSQPGSVNALVDDLREASAAAVPGLLPLTVSLGGIALLTSMGWLMERRRRRVQEDSVFWADVQPAEASSLMTKAHTLDDILPDGPTAAEAARAIYVTAIGETTSRREATLIDLHGLDKNLQRRLKRGDRNAAVLLLQQHLVDYRYTSPWVFLELRELYLVLGLQEEWDIARDAFRTRFGQNAPVWAAPSTVNAELLDDEQLCKGVSAQWPHRPTRMWMLRWLLGEQDMRIKSMGPPQLPLGVYRDLMMLDRVLDAVMKPITAYQDTVQG
jgi:hypothetical protein